jgi:hypothetical protein
MVLTLSLVAASTGWACSCAPPESVSKAIEQASAVFAGRITRLEQVGEGFLQKKKATFAVEMAWKGADIRREVEVLTNLHSASCGLGFQVGQAWVIYAHQRPDRVGGGLGSNLCTRSRKLGDDQAKDEHERIELGPPTVNFPDEVQEAPTLEDLDGGPLPPDP